MLTRYIKPENEKHWLELRTKNINSTESACLFGLHNENYQQSELELFYRKQSGELPEFEENNRMVAGRLLEPGIADIVAHTMKAKNEPFKDYAYDDESRMGSSFDYEIVEGEYEGWILEIKLVDYIVYKNKWQEDEAPDHIEVQVQHQLELTQRPGAIIAALVGGNELKLIYRKRNSAAGAGIRNKIKTFWDRVKNDKPPQPNYDLDADFIIACHQSSTNEVFNATEDENVTQLMHRYKELSELKSKTERELKSTKAEILDTIGEASKVVCDKLKLSCGMTKENPGKEITQEMVGQKIGGRKGYRMFRVDDR